MNDISEKLQTHAVQSLGALIAFRPIDETVTHASANFEDVTGISDIIGRNIRDTFGSKIRHALKNVVTLPTIHRRREYLGSFESDGREFDLSAIKENGHLLVEFEARWNDEVPTAYDSLKDALLFSDKIADCTSTKDALQKCVSLLRTIGGYDYIGAIKTDGDRIEIVADEGHLQSPQDLLTALPAQFTIFDLNTEAVSFSGQDGEPDLRLDLCALKYPGADVREKLENAGTVAGYSVEILVRDQVWGRFVTLHRAPRHPSHRMRLAIAHLQPILDPVLRQSS